MAVFLENIRIHCSEPSFVAGKISPGSGPCCSNSVRSTVRQVMPDNLGKRLARHVHPRTSEFVHFARWEFAVATRHAGIPTLLVRVRAAQIQSVQVSGKSCRTIWEKDLSDKSFPGLANSCIMHIWNSPLQRGTPEIRPLGLPQNLRRGGSGPRRRDLTTRPPEADLLANVVRINRKNAPLTPTFFRVGPDILQKNAPCHSVCV